VSWYDTRNSPNNQKAQRFVTVSDDGGQTFLPDIAVSTGMSDAMASEPPPKDWYLAGQGGFDYGDYAFDTFGFFNGVYHMVWMDNSNSTGDNPPDANGKQRMDIYTAAVTVTNRVRVASAR
jgi:hypothetical protein